jgi:hypothetical protein
VETFFLICAALGGTLMVLQLLTGLVGLGGDHDADHDAGHDGADVDHDANWFVGVLSVRALIAAVTFFGLGGLAALQYGVTGPAAIGVAVGAGALALYLVASLMRLLAKLRDEGTARIERSVGRTGSVYLRVPAERAGLGKVHLMLQNRTVEYQAVTAGPELPTGAPVKVVAVLSSDTVEVEAA